MSQGCRPAREGQRSCGAGVGGQHTAVNTCMRIQHGMQARPAGHAKVRVCAGLTSCSVARVLHCEAEYVSTVCRQGRSLRRRISTGRLLEFEWHAGWQLSALWPAERALVIRLASALVPHHSTQTSAERANGIIACGGQFRLQCRACTGEAKDRHA